MKNIIVQVDEETHRRVKAKSALKGVTIKSVFLGMISQWLKRKS
jgi:hypothetical protein